ncbi:hypothetical protein ACTXT7_015851 [Hymenolepis weldensis]
MTALSNQFCFKGKPKTSSFGLDLKEKPPMDLEYDDSSYLNLLKDHFYMHTDERGVSQAFILIVTPPVRLTWIFLRAYNDWHLL